MGMQESAKVGKFLFISALARHMLGGFAINKARSALGFPPALRQLYSPCDSLMRL
jgi:hypothetical protein